MFVGVALVPRYKDRDLISVEGREGRGGLAGGSLGWMTGAEWWDQHNTQSVSQSPASPVSPVSTYSQTF